MDVPGCGQIAIPDGPLFGRMVGGASPGVGSAKAKICVRVSATATVAVDYGTDPCLKEYTTATAPASASSSTDYTALVPLTGLDANTTSDSRLVLHDCRPSTDECDPDASPFRTFTTFPVDGSSTGKFAFAFTADGINVKENTGITPNVTLSLTRTLLQ
jgi:phosphodiesterase/alkaline phosphatase D-like protein